MKREVAYIPVVMGVLLVISFGILGCKGTTISPTEPSSVEPTPVPDPTATPDRTSMSTPHQGYDGYGETPTDPNLLTLDPDEKPYTITMDYTGDIDWYKIRIPKNTRTLRIVLTDIPAKSDYDIVVYDANLQELPNGRSAQSGNTSEKLSLSSPFDSIIYIQIYSYTGRGEASLTLTTEGTEEEVTQLTYENVLSTYYPLYPRGTRDRLLERSVETTKVVEMTCQTLDGVLSGELTIGNYAHVSRELMKTEDYIDGWALVVFNGPVSLLDQLTLRIRITIFAPELNLEIRIPPEIKIQGSSYVVSETENDVYYMSLAYGDFWGNTSDDIRISSGVVGDLGDLFSHNIFTQQVEVEWQWDHSGKNTCSGKTTGKQIIDFESANLLWLN